MVDNLTPDQMTEKAVLIVADDRNDRKTLFDVLDAHGFAAVYSARNLEQAEQLMAQDQRIALVFLEVGNRTPVITKFSEAAQKAGASVVGVVEDKSLAARESDWPLPGFVSMIRSPVLAGDLNQFLSGAGVVRTPVPIEQGGPHTSIESEIFDRLPLPAALLNPNQLRVEAINRHLARRLGKHRAKQAVGTALPKLLSGRNRAAWEQMINRLSNDGYALIRGNIKRHDDEEEQVSGRVQLLTSGTRPQYLAVFEPREALHRLESAFALVSQQIGESSDREKAQDQLAAWLDVDTLVCAALDGDDRASLQLMHASGTLPAPEGMLSISEHLPLRTILRGSPVLTRGGAAQSFRQDQVISEHHFESYIGLPICSREQKVIGALMAASSEPLDNWDLALATLRSLAAIRGLDFELRRTNEDNVRQGLHDSVTDLPNRTLFVDRLNGAVAEARRGGEMLAVMFVDLDRFKTVNDSLGHTVGDRLLKCVAERLVDTVRSSDTVARYAGDEFTVILRHIVNKDDVKRIAQKLIKALEQPMDVDDGGELQTSASIGIAFYPDDAQLPEQLVKAADRAMYQAKALGRNTFEFYVDSDTEVDQQRLKLENLLRNAESEDQLRLYYQPQVSSETEDIIGMEALIRWEHPELGLISPGLFIPIAEDSGLIVPIGEWVLRQACRDTKLWREQFQLPLRISVNLSALQLRQPDLFETIERIVNETGLDPRALELEVTESIDIKSIRNLTNTLSRLREIGCTVAIDDFGTGQSSLEYLKRFPADRIKVDQSFVRNIGIDPDDEAIVHATIAMAHKLNMEVIAEGVEEEDHLEFLRRHRCEELQGYLFCRPLPADSFGRMLEDRASIFSQASHDQEAFEPTEEAASG